jgi:hypothetical protein
VNTEYFHKISKLQNIGARQMDEEPRTADEVFCHIGLPIPRCPVQRGFAIVARGRRPDDLYATNAKSNCYAKQCERKREN